MTPCLPDDPDLDQLRKQARDFQSGVRAGVPGSLALVAEHLPYPPRASSVGPSIPRNPDGTLADPARFPLHAAQLVLARHYGFRSWPALVKHLKVVAEHSRVPDVAPPSDDPATEFLRRACLTYGEPDGPLQLSAAAILTPELVHESIHVAAACADVDAVARHLAADPGLAVREGGPHHWAPIAYLAYARHDPTLREPAVVGTARLLLDHGADPNTGYLWHGLTTPFTLVTGAFGGGEGDQPPHPQSLALARVLLEAGADPNDGQTLYNRMFSPADDHLDLLFAFGLGTGDGGPWRRLLGDEVDSPAGMVRDQLSWAVTHGFVRRVALLAEHGVDLTAPLPGEYGQPVRTPYEAALISGRFEVARYLEERGAATPVDAPDRLLAAVLAGDRTAVDRLGPAALARARADRPGFVVWAAVAGGPDAVRLAVELGWDVSARARTDVPSDVEWETALHHAAREGDVELARTLLELGADPDVRDCRFDAPPLGWARYSERAELVALLEPLTT